MRVLIIGSEDHGNKNDPQKIAQSLHESSIDAKFISWESLFFNIESTRVSVTHEGNELHGMNPDLVIAVGWYKSGKSSITRDVALSLAEYLKHNNIKFWNSEMADQRSTGKLSCMVNLALNGVPVPSTKFSLSGEVLYGYLALPAVIKASNASRGNSNFLVHQDSQARDLLLNNNGLNQMLIQPFMPNDHDLRVICFDSRPTLIMRRSRARDSDSHMNNTSQGGSADWISTDDVSPQLLTESVKVCNIMNREMAGIDFIPDANSPSGYACLEVNAIPQLTSGFDVQRKLTALAKSIQTNRTEHL